MRLRAGVLQTVLLCLTVSCRGTSAPTAPPTSPSPPPVSSTPVLTSMTVSLTPVIVRVGQSAVAAVRGFDQNGELFPIATPAWSSSDSGVARLMPSGAISSLAAGEVTITARAFGKQGTATFTVAPAAAPDDPVASMRLSPFSGVVMLGQTVELSATLSDAFGVTLTGRRITWTSTSPSVATVSSTGVVSGLVVGEVIIEASSETQHAAAALTVVPVVDPRIVITVGAPSVDMVVKDTLRVFAHVSPDSAISVVASVGSLQVALKLMNIGKVIPVNGWAGQLDLSYLPVGPYDLTLVATDSRGHRGVTTVPFVRQPIMDGGTSQPRGGSKLVLPSSKPLVP